MIFKAIEWQDASGVPEHDYEEVPQEDLWEDGELHLRDVEQKILLHVLNQGDWMIIRRAEYGED